MNRKLPVTILAFVVVFSMVAPALAVNVNAEESQPPRFGDSSFSTHIGDTTYFTVDYSTEYSNKTLLKIGDKDEVGYVLKAEITGASPYEDVTLEFDSTAAGIASEPTIRVVGNSDASVKITRETRLSDHPIDPATYPMELRYDGKISDLSQIRLLQSDAPEPIELLRMQTNTDVTELYEKDGLSREHTIAEGDNAVVRFNVNGTFNYLGDKYSATDFEKGGEVHENHGIFITLKQTETEINKDPEKLSLDNAEIYMNEEQGKSLLVINTNKYNMESGDEFEVTIHVTKDNEYLNSGEYTTGFRMTERKIDLNTHEDNIIYVETGYYSEAITGNSTLSEGTSITAVLQRDSNPAVFVREHTQVRENGRISFDINLDSDIPDGTQIDLYFANVEGGATLYVTEDGEPPDEPRTDTTTQLPDGTTGTQNIPTTTEPTKTSKPNNTTTPTKNTQNPTNTPTSTDDDDGGFPKPPKPGQPGYGFLVSILAVIGGLILVARRS